MRLCLPPAPASVGRARDAVRAHAVGAGMGTGRVDDVGLAVSEAVTNAVNAHQRAHTNAPVVVEAHAHEPEELEVVVADVGAGFEPPTAQQCQQRAASETGAVVGGLGITVMWAVVDDLAFEQDAGTTVRMRFALTG